VPQWQPDSGNVHVVRAGTVMGKNTGKNGRKQSLDVVLIEKSTWRARRRLDVAIFACLAELAELV
jgi:hypothetical protein